MARNSGNRRNSNNRQNDSWYSGSMDMVREKPIKTAAAAAAAVGAGVFLWNRRNQISDQISNLSDQIGEWAESMNLPERMGMAGDDTGGLTTGQEGSDNSGNTARSGRTSRSTGSRKTMTRGMSETGSGNASLGASSGGSGTPTS